MEIKRIHIFGASGSGTTTLGRRLAEVNGCPHFDCDDYFWEPTDPPFQTTRPLLKRQQLLRHDIQTHHAWTLSGSLVTWGDPFIPLFDLAVFLYLPTEIRIARIHDREIEYYGEAAIAPGGKMAKQYLDFIEWSQGYDTGGVDGRSLLRHENWIEQLPCPVLRIEGDLSTDERLLHINEFMKSNSK